MVLKNMPTSITSHFSIIGLFANGGASSFFKGVEGEAVGEESGESGDREGGDIGGESGERGGGERPIDGIDGDEGVDDVGGKSGG